VLFIVFCSFLHQKMAQKVLCPLKLRRSGAFAKGRVLQAGDYSGQKNKAGRQSASPRVDYEIRVIDLY